MASNEEFDQNSDLYQLGLHLHFEHGFVEPQAFDRNIRFGLLEIVNPNEIDKKEYQYMHKLNTFQPHGINVEYPFEIPFLGLRQKIQMLTSNKIYRPFIVFIFRIFL